MKIKNNSKVFLFLIAFFLIGLLIVSQSINAQEFDVPAPLALSSNPDVRCTFINQLAVIDSNGNSRSYNTRTFSDYVKFDITEKGSKAIGFNVTPKLGCNSRNLDIIIQPTSLTYSFFATDENGRQKLVKSGTFKSDMVMLPKGSTTQKDLGYFSVYASDIEKVIGKGNYKTKVSASVDGILTVSYKQYPVKFYFQLHGSKTLVSKSIDVSLPIQKDMDRDGITDDRDRCPQNPENYNGYNDTDGCPDVSPTMPSQVQTTTSTHLSSETTASPILRGSIDVGYKVFYHDGTTKSGLIQKRTNINFNPFSFIDPNIDKRDKRVDEIELQVYADTFSNGRFKLIQNQLIWKILTEIGSGVSVEDTPKSVKPEPIFYTGKILLSTITIDLNAIEAQLIKYTNIRPAGDTVYITLIADGFFTLEEQSGQLYNSHFTSMNNKLITIALQYVTDERTFSHSVSGTISNIGDQLEQTFCRNDILECKEVNTTNIINAYPTIAIANEVQKIIDLFKSRFR